MLGVLMVCANRTRPHIAAPMSGCRTVRYECVADLPSVRLPRRRYDRHMGRSGMKRKGRRHLPKVGSPANIDYEIHERRKAALHPFSSDPDARRGPSSTFVAIGVFLIVVIAIIALIALTA